MRRRVLSVLSVFAALGGPLACGGEDDARPRPRATATSASSGAIEGRFDVGQRKLYIECVGRGAPAVIFQAGYPSESAPYVSVAREVGETTRACVYDRADLGRSDASPGSRDGLQVVNDLEALLRSASVPRPYVLVGHSFGGVLSMLYAAEHPEAVRGIVLLDAAHPNTEAEYTKLIPPRDRLRLLAEEQRAEPLDLEKASQQLRARLGSLPDVPMTVITASRYDDLPSNWPRRRMHGIWLRQQRDYVRMIPGARHVMADTHHNVHEENPDLVVQEIATVVRQAEGR